MAHLFGYVSISLTRDNRCRLIIVNKVVCNWCGNEPWHKSWSRLFCFLIVQHLWTCFNLRCRRFQSFNFSLTHICFMLCQKKVSKVKGMATLLKLFSCHLCRLSLIFHFISGNSRDESFLNLDTSLHVWLDNFISVAKIFREQFLNASFRILGFAFGPITTSSALLLILRAAITSSIIDFILAFLSVANRLNYFMTLISRNCCMIARAIARIIQVIILMCTLTLHGKFFLWNESTPSDTLWLYTLPSAHIRLLGLRKVTPVKMRCAAWNSI